MPQANSRREVRYRTHPTQTQNAPHLRALALGSARQLSLMGTESSEQQRPTTPPPFRDPKTESGFSFVAVRHIRHYTTRHVIA
jgi:hypothetical protein